MPQGEPQFGEIWTFDRTGATAIVVKVRREQDWTGREDCFVTFVSLTGIRTSLLLNEFWSFREPVPENAKFCSCEECSSSQAFIRYQRPTLRQTFSEIVCPLHVPKGVQSEIVHAAMYQKSERFHAQKCRKCKEDATEVFGEVPIGLRGSMWNCQTCGKWWINGTITDESLRDRSLADMVQKYYELGGYNIMSVDMYTDPRSQEHNFDIFLKPKLSHRIKGPPKAFTIYDHLREEEL